jgi:hypothetical protein
MMEELSSSETSALSKATGRNIPEDSILHSHLSENLKSYIKLSCMQMNFILQMFKPRNLWCHSYIKFVVIIILEK